MMAGNQDPPSPPRIVRSDNQSGEPERGFFGRHPSLGGSIVPALGPAREAYADYLDGNETGAAINAGLALADLTGEGVIARDLLKGGLKLSGSHTWGATRKWLGKNDVLGFGQHGHHGLIPQNGWGKAVPDFIKNQPFNIKGMASPEIHGRIHGRYAGKPQFNVAQRFWEGTPRWWKAGVAEVLGTPLRAVEPQLQHEMGNKQ